MSDKPEESDVAALQQKNIEEEEDLDYLDLPADDDSDRQSFTRSRPFDAFDKSIEPTPAPALNGTSFKGYGNVSPVASEEDEAEASASPTLSAQVDDLASPDRTPSFQDDLPSVRGSLPSSPPSNSRTTSQLSIRRTPRPGGLQPFDRRFSARQPPSPLASPRGGSPGFLRSHSRQSSVASTLVQSLEGSESSQAPWEVVRWTRLRKITGQVFSELGKRNYGIPTVIAVAASIIIGTSKGLTLIFDYQQQLTATIGIGTKAVESGSVTSLAVSADHSTIACGHSSGDIFTWELSRPAKPFLHIPPVSNSPGAPRKSDGHVADTSVIHVGFLGMRHTALVSADLGGMAFSHLATRGLGAVARSVKTQRLLGRYPMPVAPTDKVRRASSVLAFAPLPLGNIEQPTDTFGLTAMLTPYLLVIVSTTPVAETQFKTARPKELEPHSTLSGCLAWFPAVKLKHPTKAGQTEVSKTKLVYSWSNVLTILDVESQPSEEKDKPPSLHFKPRSRWKSDEAIVAIQWLHRSVLGILTISQRLLIVEDTTTLRMTDSFDLLHKHIYHQDLFSRQLRAAVEQLDEQDHSMHGVVADAFHMSFRAYKGRLFILGFNDVSIGTLSNWADRLVALMEEGDFIAAIQLATTYYQGTADKISVGLPEDDQARHALVQEKLLDMISASLRYIFNGDVLENADYNERQRRLTELASTSFTACTIMRNFNFLFDTIYEAYENESFQIVFFEVLEPYILDGEITTVPPNVLKDMITYYAALGRDTRLQELICQLDTKTLDLNQVTSLCKSHLLFDALIYVWNQAIGDFVTPLVELMNLIRILEATDAESKEDQTQQLKAAMKIFPYLANVFTGRIYPSGTDRPEDEAYTSKEQVYRFLFAGRVQDWPAGSGRFFRTMADESDEPSYPYLNLILRFDTPAFMSVLNEAFEDDFLNGFTEATSNGTSMDGGHVRRSSSLLPTRQTIISILMEVLSEEAFRTEDSIYFDMFIARNLPKFPQFIILPGGTLHSVLEHLCEFPLDEMADDCQLSVEYLLSFYHPSDLNRLIPLFQKARFYRVLKTVYRGQKLYPQLVKVYLEDPDDREEVFACLQECLAPSASLTPRQTKEVASIIVDDSLQLASIDATRLAQTLQSNAYHLVNPVLDALQAQPMYQYIYLKALLEQQDQEKQQSATEEMTKRLEEQYVRLMCRFDPTRVAEYIDMLKSGDLKLDAVLPAMEDSGVIDAAVILMARDGLVTDAMDRLVAHLKTLQSALTSFIETVSEEPDAYLSPEPMDELLQAVQKYSKVGIWLCQGQSKNADAQSRKLPVKLRLEDDSEESLSTDERLWLDLVDGIVNVAQHVSESVEHLPEHRVLDIDRCTATIKSTIQQVFTALLTATTSPPPSHPQITSPLKSTFTTRQPDPTFLRILRAFLTRASQSSPSLSHLRSVLTSIFSAFTFEETILDIANTFLDKDLFTQVDESYRLRQQGWRPKGNTCEGCGRRAWGPGTGGEIWDEWEANRRAEEEDRMQRRRQSLKSALEDVERRGRGKGRATTGPATAAFSARSKSPVARRDQMNADETPPEEGLFSPRSVMSSSSRSANKPDLGPLIVFACRHIWHQDCLERAMDMTDRFEGWRMKKDGNGDPRCPLESEVDGTLGD